MKLYRENTLRSDGFLGLEDGAIPKYVVPVTIDYEAAAIAMLGLLQNKNVSSRQLVYGTVDAALGGQDEA